MTLNSLNATKIQQNHPFVYSALRSVFRSTLRVRYWPRHRALIDGALGANPAMLQIGCGKNILPNWLNTDLRPGPSAVFLDASTEFPFSDSSFDYVFSEHLIEHLNYKAGEQMVTEIFRILKPKGRIRIATPDFDFLLNLYLRPGDPVHQRYIVWSADLFPVAAPPTAVSVVNNFFRDWGHQYIYSRETLRSLLVDSGFCSIVPCVPGESADPHLRGIDCHSSLIGDEFNRLETMVLEGVKPS